jgi:hypothetical protein
VDEEQEVEQTFPLPMAFPTLCHPKEPPLLETHSTMFRRFSFVDGMTFFIKFIV